MGTLVDGSRRLAISLVALAVVASFGLFAFLLPAAASPSAAGCTPNWHTIVRAGMPAASGLVAVSPDDVWVVGQRQARPGHVVPAIVHWDGRTLRRDVVYVPKAHSVVLSAVAASSADDVWAVGSDRVSGGGERPVTMHWNGVGWRVIPVPRLPGDGWLAGVVAIATNDVWAVGGLSLGWPLVLHWDGRRWHGGYGNQLRAIVPYWNYSGAIYGTHLQDVVAPAPNDVWAIGTKEFVDFGGIYPVVLHWDGRRWAQVTGPEGGTEGEAVAAAAGDVTTLSDDSDEADAHGGRGYYLTRWNDPTRRMAQVYYAPTDSVSDLAEIARNNIWLVGTHWSADGNTMLGPLVIHWDGRRERITQTPFSSLRNATLEAASALSATDVWAAGNGLLARYSC
jgi:hypothetical protein